MERPHAAEQTLDDESDSSPVPPRRPSALPIAHIGSAPVSPGFEAPRPAPRPVERPPVLLFDRALGAEIHAPSDIPPRAAEQPTPAAELPPAFLAEIAEADKPEGEDDEDAGTTPHQYVLPIIPSAVRRPITLSERPTPSVETAAAAPVVEAAPEPPAAERFPTEKTKEIADEFERMMAAAGIDFSAEAAAATSSEADESADPVVATHSTPPPSTNAYRMPPMPNHNTPYTPGGGGGGNQPPQVPPVGGSSGGYGGGSGGSGTVRTSYAASPGMPSLPRFNTLPTTGGYTDTDLHNARKEGTRRGFTTGLLAGGLAGHYFTKRKARKQQERMQREHATEIERRDTLQIQQQQQIDRLQPQTEIRDAITGRLAGTGNTEAVPGIFTQSPMAAERVAAQPQPQAERPVYVPASPALTAERPRPLAMPDSAPSGPAAFERPMPGYADIPRPRVGGEAIPPLPVAVAGYAEAPVMPQQPETGIEEQAEAPSVNPFERQAEQPHHKIRSSWLEIGVDAQGHAVKQEYGRAFQEEVRQESSGGTRQLRDDRPRTGVMDSGNAGPHGASYYIGGSAVGGQAQQPYHQDHYLQPGQPTHSDPQHLLPSPKHAGNNVANPWFWLMLGIVIAAFFAATLI